MDIPKYKKKGWSFGIEIEEDKEKRSLVVDITCGLILALSAWGILILSAAFI